MADPWGVDEPPADVATPPLPPRLARLAAVTEPVDAAAAGLLPWRWVQPADLPEVQALQRDGWQPLLDADVFALLPAAWPREHRAWIPDRLPRVWLAADPEPPRAIPVDAEELERQREETAARASAVGLTPPPPGWIWLLRSPWPSLGMAAVMSFISQRETARQAARRTDTDRESGYAAALEVLRLDEDEVWATWSGPVAEAARAWRAEGRTGPSLDPLLNLALAPADLARLRAVGLDEEQALAWCRAVDRWGPDAVSAVERWRALGLPAVPPADAATALRLHPDEAAEWVAAGFALDETADLKARDLPLAVALRDVGVPRELRRVLHPRQVAPALAARWHSSGIGPERIALLVAVDRELLPEQALAYDDAGVAAVDQPDWVAGGVPPAEARAWQDADVLPGEAEVWRAVGKTPADVPPWPVQLDPAASHLPPGVPVGWTAYGGGRRARRFTLARHSPDGPSEPD